MENTTTKRQIKDELLIEGLKAAGLAIGIHSTKGAIKKTVSRNFSIVNSLMEAAFAGSGNSNHKIKRNIEIGSLGVIALYNIVKGIKSTRKGLLAEGVFLSLALGVVLIGANVNTKNKHIRRLTEKRIN